MYGLGDSMGEKENKQYCMCIKKRIYNNKKRAKSTVNKMRRCGLENLHPYQCPYCGLFHVGHKRKETK